MDRIIDILLKAVAALFALLFAPIRLLAAALGPGRSEADLIDEVASEVRQAEQRIEYAGEPLEPLAVMARNFIQGGVADICRLPLRQQAWLHAARASGVDVSSVSDRDLEFHVRGTASSHGLTALVDPGRLARVRQVYERAKADQDWNPEPAFGVRYDLPN